MATVINASTSGAGGAIITPDNTGVLQLKTAGTTALTISSSQVVTLANVLPVGSGGTGLASPGTSGYVLTSNGTAWVSAPSSDALPSPGSSGQVLTSDGTDWVSQALPSQLPSASTSGNILRANGTAWTSAAPSTILPSVGTSGNVLTSDGTSWSSSAIPSQLPSASTSGNILRANGTAWVSATPQSVLPSPSTSGNVLTANGTAWISEAPQSRQGFLNAWVVFNVETNRAITIKKSYNISAVSRLSSGRYQITINNGVFSDGNYCITTGVSTFNGGDSGSYTIRNSDHTINFEIPTATTVIINTGDPSIGGNVAHDVLSVHVMMVG
jgi:hypothetical protein